MTSAAAPLADPAWSSSRKSGRTRAAIVSAALQLFRDRGYDGTTMRAIADVAGVSPGNAYYYFRSKEELVQELYDRLCTRHAETAGGLVGAGAKLGPNLRRVLRCWIHLAEPYRPLAGRFLAVALEGETLAEHSHEARDAERGLYAAVVEGSCTGVDPQLRAHLPDLLWSYHLAVVLFWAHDRSPKLRRTELLVDRSAPIVGRLVRLSRLPVLHPVSVQAADMLRLLRVS